MSAARVIAIDGPSGSGKSLLGTHFIAEGLRQGEPGRSWDRNVPVIVVTARDDDADESR